MYVDPRQLLELGRTHLDASIDLNQEWSGDRSRLTPDGNAAGNSDAAPELLAAHAGAVDAADVAIGRLVAVLELDADALYQCAFDVETTDEAQAERYESTGPIFPLFGAAS